MQSITAPLLAAALIAIGSEAIRAETFLIQSGEDSSPYAFTPNLARGYRNTAYAFTNELDGEDHSFEYYIRFDLPPELLEPGVSVDYAYAWVYYGFDYTLFGDTTDEVGEILCHEVLAPWSEATLTWNNRPPIGPVFDGWVDVTEKGLYWCDVTELVTGWVSGDFPNHGIAITSTQPRVLGFYTWDDGSVSSNYQPSLVVKTLPEPRLAAGLSVGAALLLALHRRRDRRDCSFPTTRQESEMKVSSIVALMMISGLPAGAQSYSVTVDPVAFDRWMYPFNGTPGTRNLAPTFGAVSDAPDFDNKDGQLIVAVDTEAAGILRGEGVSNYHPTRVRITATHFQGAFAYDPTYDSWRTYLDPLDPLYLPDSDTGRPIELYGVGLRNGYVGPLVIGAITAAGPPGFEENERYCEGCGFFGQGKRNAFALDFGVPDAEGDVSNNVRRLPPLLGGGFDPSPWAIGKSTSGVAPGAAVPQGTFGASAGETFEFVVNLGDPDVLQYVQSGLDAGVLAFAIVSMHETAEQQGGSNPNFYASENNDAAAIAPTVEIDVTLPEPGAAAGLLSGGVALGILGRRRRARTRSVCEVA